ncbi:TlpA disulfide reductase family protein [Pedobacter immunditicola]|uniref:TlpA disulfide reductase family protein n=1 Tax=Pedobacter immunditicola TaxID=3133440 RepID=UPI00309FF71D
MRKIIFITALFSLILLQASAQRVGLMTAQKLQQRISQGKDTVFVVNFWATWCVPCVKELPNFEQLQKKFSNKPLKVLLVSLDFKSRLESDLKPFLNRMKIMSEVFLMNDQDEQIFIQKIDKNWEGNLPATLVVNTSRNRRQFIPNELTYNELLAIYNLNK